VVIEKVVLQTQVPIKVTGFQVHWYGTKHRQAVLPTFGPLLLVIFEQLTQVPLMIELVVALQVQVLAFAFKLKVDGQLQVVEALFQTKFFLQTHILPLTAPVA
jgi:hypothetical protein